MDTLIHPLASKIAEPTAKAISDCLKSLPQNAKRSMIGTLNTTPRKCLGFKTPEEVFIENLSGALEM